MSPRFLRVSELGEFTFCQRAWWYTQQGIPSGATWQQAAGLKWHGRQERRARLSSYLGWLGAGLLAISGVIAAWLWLVAPGG